MFKKIFLIAMLSLLFCQARTLTNKEIANYNDSLLMEALRKRDYSLAVDLVIGNCSLLAGDYAQRDFTNADFTEIIDEIINQPLVINGIARDNLKKNWGEFVLHSALMFEKCRCCYHEEFYRRRF